MLKKEEDCNVLLSISLKIFFSLFFCFVPRFFRVFKTRGFRKAFEVFGGEKRELRPQNTEKASSSVRRRVVSVYDSSLL